MDTEQFGPVRGRHAVSAKSMVTFAAVLTMLGVAIAAVEVILDYVDPAVLGKDVTCAAGYCTEIRGKAGLWIAIPIVVLSFAVILLAIALVLLAVFAGGMLYVASVPPERKIGNALVPTFSDGQSTLGGAVLGIALVGSTLSFAVYLMAVPLRRRRR